MVMIKPGVRIDGLQPVMNTALVIVESVFREFGYHTVITSGTDGRHAAGSLHHAGKALDFRTRHVKAGGRKALADQVAEALGPEFDVVLKTRPHHLHVEYDPK